MGVGRLGRGDLTPWNLKFDIFLKTFSKKVRFLVSRE